MTYVLSEGEKVTVTAPEGDNLLDIVINNDIDIDGFGACEGQARKTLKIAWDPEFPRKIAFEFFFSKYPYLLNKSISMQKRATLKAKYFVFCPSNLECQMHFYRILSEMHFMPNNDLERNISYFILIASTKKYYKMHLPLPFKVVTLAFHSLH